MANQLDPLGNVVTTPAGNTITTTASNVFQSSIATTGNIVSGTAGIIVNGAASTAAGIAGAVVGAAIAPVVDVARKVNTVVDLIKNPSLGGALALLGQGFPPYRNELDQFASYNYIFTLSCLTTVELNFPLSYRTVGPLIQIIKSGGTGGKKIPTIYETDGIVEFFVDDIEIAATISPTSMVRHTNAHKITFKVIEPYSMGQFIQNLRTAALVAGHNNYIEAPFLLSVEFTGYDDEGNVKTPFFSKRHFPIKIIKADMNITEAGAVYDVLAAPYNEIALMDSVQTLVQDVEIRGSTVGEVLQSGAASLSSIINQRQLALEESKNIPVADQYVIAFPQSGAAEGLLGSVGTALSAVTPGGSSQRTQLYQSLSGDKGGDIPADFDAKLKELQGVTVPRSAVGQAVSAQANLSSIWNTIGKAPIVKNFTDYGKIPFGEPKFSEIQGQPGVFQRGKLTISDDNRKFTFKSGTKITEIIEEIILISDYGRQFVKATPDAKGKVPWFRIEVHTYTVSDFTTIATTGKSPKIYVYRVVPYMIDASINESPSAPSLGQFLKQSSAIKAYNYIYTGQNKDIINFDLNFNLAFYSSISADRGSLTSAAKKGATDEAVKSDPQPAFRQGQSLPTIAGANGQAATGESPAPSTGSKGGGGKEHAENSLARVFNDNFVNSDNDLIQVDLEIHGDPYYMADAGLGNYLGIANPLNQAITLEGAMNPFGGEVDVILNFRTPIDYDGDDGFVKYPLGGFLPIGMFSGLYKVVTVNNKFTRGKFSQVLKLVRRRNQDLTLEALAGAAVSAFNEAKSMVPGTKKNKLDETPNDEE